MSLREYRSKRKFASTPEPSANLGRKAESGRLSFVVQKHAARNLHYDFRLEHEGALKSWAVPKGPSRKLHEKRLAVQVEDHPLEYGNFEGTIPRGNYGAGKVEIWDRGEWLPDGSAKEGFKKGKLSFQLKGKKLRGNYVLVRMHGKPKQWLLIKEDSPIPNGSTNTPSKISQLSREPLPAFIAPALASRVKDAPEESDWLHEIKLDGYRILARKQGKQIKLLSRNNLDWTAKAPHIVRELARLDASDVILDGELVVFDEKGISTFQELQNAQKTPSEAKMKFIVFDILHLNGNNLRVLPLSDRKKILRRVCTRSLKSIIVNPFVSGNGPDAALTACRQGLEGIISKRANSLYQSGRGVDWLKIKCDNSQEFIICGFTPHSKRKGIIGAILLCLSTGKNSFAYAGKVGTGFDEKTRRELFLLLSPDQNKKIHITGLPRSRTAVFVTPKHIVQIHFREFTNDSLVRQGVFQGLRKDKTPEQVKPEPTLKPIHLTHPKKLLFPESGFTKMDYAEYLQAVGTRMIDDLKERPLSIVRCPDGVGGPQFFQKHRHDSLPDAIQRCEFKNEEGEMESYIVVDSAEALAAFAQIAAIEIHSWNASCKQITTPNRFVIDLDPDSGVRNSVVVDTAFRLREILAEIQLTSFVRVSGGKGLHVVVPLNPKGSWDEVKEFTKTFVELLAEHSSLYTTVASKQKRKDKIFLDYLRNGWGATSIANYSLRARPTPSVAVPISWDEVNKRMKFDRYSPAKVMKMMSEPNPWDTYKNVRQQVSGRSLKQLKTISKEIVQILRAAD